MDLGGYHRGLGLEASEASCLETTYPPCFGSSSDDIVVWVVFTDSRDDAGFNEGIMLVVTHRAHISQRRNIATTSYPEFYSLYD